MIRRPAPPPGADWAALALVGQVRLLMLFAVAAVYYAAADQRTLGARDAELFEIAHLGYAVFAFGCTLAVRLRRPAPETQLYLQSYADIVLVALLAYASGGAQSGLAAWLVVNIALLGHLARLRHALLFAAIATLTVLAGELVASVAIGSDAAAFERTALLGSLLFVVAWLTSVPLRRLAARHLTEATAGRARLDIEQVAQLNEEIVGALDSGIVAVDARGEVVLVNDTARALLAAEFTALPIPLARLSDALAENLADVRRSPTLGARPFAIESTGQSCLAQYTPLANGGLLIRLDDHAHIRAQFQQLKLASLGRLSASIAHEIRNPLGAISHAVQLIEESESLAPEDAELLDVARRHATRIDRIVNDVLQLSNRQRVARDPIDVASLVRGFCERFTAENALAEGSLRHEVEPGLVAVFDPGHLDQILWNLCSNARRHNEDREVRVTVSCFESAPGSVVIEVADDGAGITDIEREQLFEPFYTTHHGGSGLGLYIIRELCELNRAAIECVEQARGARFRITLASAGRLAA